MTGFGSGGAEATTFVITVRANTNKSHRSDRVLNGKRIGGTPLSVHFGLGERNSIHQQRKVNYEFKRLDATAAAAGGVRDGGHV
jgi:hypothetical protein